MSGLQYTATQLYENSTQGLKLQHPSDWAVTGRQFNSITLASKSKSGGILREIIKVPEGIRLDLKRAAEFFGLSNETNSQTLQSSLYCVCCYTNKYYFSSTDT